MTDKLLPCPDFWAVHSATGTHIGLWPSKAHADEALREYEGGTMTPLYRAPVSAVRRNVNASDLSKLIADGRVFTDANPEADFISAAEHACPHCGGSGHKDDVTPLAQRLHEWNEAGICHDCGGLFSGPSRVDPCPGRTPTPAPRAMGLPIELSGVSNALEYGKGMWRTCTGCHESNEGHPTGPYSSVMRCHLGGGCFECGGIGAVWDTTDYEDMGNALAAQATAEDKKPDNRHDFVPHKKFPWFCACCGYAPHEPLKHFPTPATSDGADNG